MPVCRTGVFIRTVAFQAALYQGASNTTMENPMIKAVSREQRQHFIALPQRMHFIACRNHQEPIEDWCMAGNSAPSAITKNMILFSRLRETFQPIRSQNAGASSSAITPI